jgi:hypothetical protein
MTPLAAVASGLLAGAVGTASMDAVRYLMYRSGGGQDAPLRRPRPRYGLPFGAAVWGFGYLVLPEGGLYKPIWQYDARTLARDLVAHLAYGAGTGTAFWALASVIRMAGSPAAHSA